MSKWIVGDAVMVTEILFTDARLGFVSIEIMQYDAQINDELVGILSQTFLWPQNQLIVWL